jgi:uncharacterized protein (DUF433 family)
MDLPDFLQPVDGEIRLKGHRVALVHVVKLYTSGYAVEMIGAQLPTLPLAQIHKVVAFYLDHRDELDALVADHDREMDRLESETRRERPTPTLAELRQRLANRGARQA